MCAYLAHVSADTVPLNKKKFTKDKIALETT
jgi:hypothetical protein